MWRRWSKISCCYSAVNPTSRPNPSWITYCIFWVTLFGSRILWSNRLQHKCLISNRVTERIVLQASQAEMSILSTFKTSSGGNPRTDSFRSWIARSKDVLWVIFCLDDLVQLGKYQWNGPTSSAWRLKSGSTVISGVTRIYEHLDPVVDRILTVWSTWIWRRDWIEPSEIGEVSFWRHIPILPSTHRILTEIGPKFGVFRNYLS
jgi:hypothetical protein